MDDQTADNSILAFRNRHSFAIFIVASIITAFVIVLVSMQLYNSSGTAQLDLSRPGYQSVQSQAVMNTDDFQDFSSSGKITADTIRDFKTLYEKQSQRVKSVDAFGGDPLSPSSLGVDLAN